jgi:hypothetical protein
LIIQLEEVLVLILYFLLILLRAVVAGVLTTPLVLVLLEFLAVLEAVAVLENLLEQEVLGILHQLTHPKETMVEIPYLMFQQRLAVVAAVHLLLAQMLRD